ncbi:MAG: HDOD domain-containing protein [Candidatus Hydrogenedentes bacterium]|nr:HDOD domain-containing protein [Candidatus Hydrogenedentota bacterium]
MVKFDINEALARIQQLPTLPAVLTQIMDAVADPDASALVLAQYIAADQALSASLLKLVNSAHYGFYRKITSVTTAIVMLGFSEVRNVALSATAFRSFARGQTEYDRTQLWRHSLATAMAADRCARAIRLRDAGVYFSAGLLHDIGKVLLDTLYPDLFLEAVRSAREQGWFLRDAERVLFGLHHGEAGWALAEHWNLPASVAEAIRFHHEPGNARFDPILTNLTTVADYIAYAAGYGESANARPIELPQPAVAALGASEDHIARVCQEMQTSAERIDELLGVLGG